MDQFIALLQAAIVFGTVILFGSVGEVLTEKSGSLNLGVPGLMYLGGIAGLTGCFFYEMNTPEPVGIICVLIGLICALAASALGGLIFGLLTITLRCNQNVTGLAFNIFAGGLANFFGGSLNKMSGGVGQLSVRFSSAAVKTDVFPFGESIGPIGKIFLSYGFMVYLAVLIALVMRWFLNRTSVGLCLRAVGENPATADAAGINVSKYKYLAAMIGGGISGLGGLFFVLDYQRGQWDGSGAIEALGWLAVALVIFASWRPSRLIWGSYLFGLLSWLYFYIPGLTRRSQELFKAMPYVVTLFVLIIVAVQHKPENQPPNALGQSYFREER